MLAYMYYPWSIEINYLLMDLLNQVLAKVTQAPVKMTVTTTIIMD